MISNMHGWVKRNQLFRQVRESLQHYPATALLGARQVGKSALAKEIIREFNPSLYLDLDFWKTSTN